MKYIKSSDADFSISIKDVQRIELDILLAFDRICKKHDIHYQLYAGSLIGAIRHNGFIPWDDDIDVCMLRSQYNQFLSIIKDELGSEYFFQTYETDPNYMNRFAKIRKNGTIFMEKLVQELDMHHGVYIDIFVFDSVELHSFQGKYQIWRIRKINSFLKYRLKSRYETLNHGFERKKAKFKYDLINSLPISKIRIENWILKMTVKFNHKNTEYVADFANPSLGVLEKFMMKRETLEDSINWDFEGHRFLVPRAYDDVLTRAYGDYMKLPDEHDRVSPHEIIKIDLGQ